MYRADFMWPQARVILEVNGGIYSPKSGHRSVTGLCRDWEKSNEAQFAGWIYLQVGSKHLKDEAYMRRIVKFIKGRLTE